MLKVEIDNNITCGFVDIYIREYTRSKTGNVVIYDLSVDETSRITSTEKREAVASLKPFLRLKPDVADTFFKGFAQLLMKEGYLPEKKYVEGKLEATEKHLEDMRKLVFEKVV